MSAFHESVRELCVDRLREALNPATALFDRQLRDRRWEGTRGTEDLTSTAICLVGIHRSGVEPGSIRLDVAKTLDALAAVARRRGYAGGLGLVLWANAVWDGWTLERLLDRAGMTLSRPAELVGSLTTMEAAWLVSGLVHELQRSRCAPARSALDVAQAELLSRFRADTRIFAHASGKGPPAHRLRRWVANFADQIYSVQALSFLRIAGGNEIALSAADASARRLVELQGSLGQWWWHYDARSGNVAQGFPVYSVHQHAMAPMALMTLAAAGGTDHRRPVELSHSWISRNEVGVGMLDREAGTLWRDVERREGALGRVSRHARSVLGLAAADGRAAPPKLKVNHETRPYEWAWCLFAGAVAAGVARPRHVV